MKTNNDGSPFSMLDALNGELQNPLQQEHDENAIVDLDNPVAVIHPSNTDDVDDDIDPLNGGEPVPGKDPEDKPAATEPTQDIEPNQDIDDGESKQVELFFDAFSESFGWQASDKKPKTIEELIDYMGEEIAQSGSNYASNEVREINEYVANGGNLEDYFNVISSMTDYNNLNLKEESTQKRVLTEFLATQGMSKDAIQRRINRYEDAGMLEDEAGDAVEYMKEFKSKEKESLLKQQEQIRIQEEQATEKFYAEVNTTIDSINDIRGIQIPASDKKQLKDYLFKLDANGKSQYDKDFSGNLVKNLLESAYFTMKGDALIKSANKSGETSAVNKLKQTLRSSSTSGRSRHDIDNSSAQPIWSAVAGSLGNANITL